MFTIEDIIEIPVTVYTLLKVPGYVKYSKIDINACSEEEITSVIKQLAGKTDPVILFLHSFSFIKWSRGSKIPVVDQMILDKFEAVLKMISSAGNIKVRTVENYYKEVLSQGILQQNHDHVPDVSLKALFKRIMDRQ